MAAKQLRSHFIFPTLLLGILLVCETKAKCNWVTVRTQDDLRALNAAACGVFIDGLPTYLARTWINGTITPGIARSFTGAWGAFLNIEVRVDVFEVCVPDRCGCLDWIPATGGQVPAEAAPVGIEANGTVTHACRVLDTTTFNMECGKILPGNQCSIPWQGKPSTYNTYEVLSYVEDNKKCSC